MSNKLDIDKKAQAEISAAVEQGLKNAGVYRNVGVITAIIQTALYNAGHYGNSRAELESKQGWVSVENLKAAFEDEIQRVSTVEYNSNSICRTFFSRLMERLADQPPEAKDE